MTKNLLNYVSGQFSDGIVNKISSMIGENSGTTKSALTAALPTILKGIINRGDTEQNVSALRKFISDEKISANSISDLSAADYLSKGSGVVDFLMGSAKNTLLGNAAKKTGLSGAVNSKLMSAIAPMALSYVSKLASSEKMSDSQLASYLDGQKNKLGNVAASRGTSSSTTTSTASSTTETSSGGGGGFLKWLLPLLLIGAALWYFMKGNKTGVDDRVDDTTTEQVEGTSSTETVTTSGTTTAESVEVTTEANGSISGTVGTAATGVAGAAGKTITAVSNSASEAAGTVTSEAGAAAESMSVSYSINADGNLVDGGGKIIAKAGEFSEKDGHYVDASGKKIGLLKKVGNAIGGAAKATAGAVSGAAVKSAEKMKEVFSGMFKSKEKVGSTYGMSKIVFDEESHRITDFSKGEVEGLAAALKAMPDAKIQVQVHGDAGKSVTGKRAEVIKAMLITLGVDKKQISSKGMGDGDAGKAASGAVEIKVEQTVE